MSSNKNVATAEEKQVAALYEGDQGTGFEDTTSADYSLPFLKLLQKLSPEVDKDEGVYIAGAEAGMYLDTGTGEILETVQFIPCHYRRAMVEWRPRSAGGGFVAQHPVGVEVDLPQDINPETGRWTGRWKTKDGNLISDTRYFFGLRLTEGGDTYPCIIAFSATQIKKARNWMTKMQGMKAVGEGGKRFQLPMFANVWDFGHVREENDQGTWCGYKIELSGPVKDPDLVEAAKSARDMFLSAADNVKPPAPDDDTYDSGGDGGIDSPI